MPDTRAARVKVRSAFGRNGEANAQIWPASPGRRHRGRGPCTVFKCVMPIDAERFRNRIGPLAFCGSPVGSADKHTLNHYNNRPISPFIGPERLHPSPLCGVSDERRPARDRLGGYTHSSRGAANRE
jgi:hypothetical protein